MVIGNEPLNKEQMQKIHNATLEVLEKIGLRVDCDKFWGPLKAAGAKVDESAHIIKFPSRIIENMLDYLKSQIKSGRRQYLLNGVTNPKWTPPLGYKFGGACIEYLDYELDTVRSPTEQDLIKLLQLGEALDSVGFVGNPVACLIDKQANNVPGPLQRIKTAAIVAKYTTKCGSTEIWNAQELEFLMELGQIVRDGENEYIQKPCFITAKETIAPLQFPADDGEILLLLAKKGLPCMIVPMPITGATCPCTPAANIVMANAEILGVFACLHKAAPQAMFGAGVITGTLDMSAGAASFSSPEALLQDIGLAQLYDNFYGQDLAIGTGYIDAKYPGAQSLSEKTMKMFSAGQIGRWNFPLGLLAGGKRFSPEQALLELEIAESIKKFFSGFEMDENTLAADVIMEVGIGGEFVSHEHTLNNFKKMWMPKLLDRRCPSTLENEKTNDMLAAAHNQLVSIWNRDDLYQIDDERAKAIDKVVASAERILK